MIDSCTPKHKYTLKRFFILLVLVCYSNPFFSQRTSTDIQIQLVTEAKLKSVFIYSFTRYFEWNRQDTLREFRIGTLGADTNIVAALKLLASKKKIGNRSIKILEFDKRKDPNTMPKLEMLYVDILNCPFFKTPKGLQNTLIVTEHDRDLSNTIIAFIRDNSKLKFVYNEYLANKMGLKISPDFRVLAFAVIESSENYEINKDIVRNNWVSVMDKIEEVIQVGADSVTFSVIELKEVSNKFKKQSTDLQLQKDMIDRQLSSIQSQEAKIKLQEQKLNLTIAQNDLQEKELLWKKEELISQQKRIVKQRAVLDSQKRNIEVQESKIKLQLEKINKQRTILTLALIAGIAILLSLGLLFYNYKKTQRTNALLAQQNYQIQSQKQTIELKQNEILDSINYAQRIQRALLASDDLLRLNLRNYFIVFKPKDVVSGDFYWASKLSNGMFALVTADSTGHGVPGAIMSMLNISCLIEAVESKELCNPSDILNYARQKVIGYLANDGSTEGGKDGMDCSLIAIDSKKSELVFAGAHNPVWIVRGKSLIELKPDKMPVGKHDLEHVLFSQQTFALQGGDMVYSLTDGLPDQFGGPKGKKFMYKRLKDELIEIAHLTPSEQKTKIETTLLDWQGIIEQVDDITLIGFRI